MLQSSGHGDLCIRNNLESLFSEGAGPIAFQYPFQKSLSENKRKQNNNLLLEQDPINSIAVLKFTYYLTSGISSTSLKCTLRYEGDSTKCYFVCAF